MNFFFGQVLDREESNLKTNPSKAIRPLEMNTQAFVYRENEITPRFPGWSNK